MIKVLIVDDSATARMVLRRALEHDPGIHVSEAATGGRALQLVSRYEPDLITMDVFLGQENGIDVVASIMASTPRPILVVTGVNPSDPQLAYRAMRAGALEVTAKLPSENDPTYNDERRQFLRLVRALSAVPVVHHRQRARRPATRPAPRPGSTPGRPEVLLVGASTGGPVVISTILSALPSPLPLPVVVVQHIAAGFAKGFADWLGSVTSHDVRLVDHNGANLEAGAVFIAPDDRNVFFSSSRRISTAPPNNNLTPSIDVAFESAATHFSNAIAVLLTGMGKDGACGLAALKQSGALTIAQRPNSCTVGSMPREAISLDAVRYVLRPEAIAPAISASITPIA